MAGFACLTVVAASLVLVFAPSLLYADGVAPLNNNSIMDYRPTGERMAVRILTENDNGSDIEIRVGQVIRVDLRIQGGTGYSWYPSCVDEKLLMPAGSKTIDLSEKGMAGGPVLGMWYFEAISPGDATLDMLYYRIWEGTDAAVKSFTVHVKIFSGEKN